MIPQLITQPDPRRPVFPETQRNGGGPEAVFCDGFGGLWLDGEGALPCGVRGDGGSDLGGFCAMP